MSVGDAAHYWDEVIAEVEVGSRALLVARVGGMAVATVQLELAAKPNALHRAEVQKLLVHRAARRLGLGAALMAAAELTARELGRNLLVLDTRAGMRQSGSTAGLATARPGASPAISAAPTARSTPR